MDVTDAPSRPRSPGTLRASVMRLLACFLVTLATTTFVHLRLSEDADVYLYLLIAAAVTSVCTAYLGGMEVAYVAGTAALLSNLAGRSLLAAAQEGAGGRDVLASLVFLAFFTGCLSPAILLGAWVGALFRAAIRHAWR